MMKRQLAFLQWKFEECWMNYVENANSPYRHKGSTIEENMKNQQIENFKNKNHGNQENL